MIARLGFTLVELMLTLAVAAILLAVAAPGFRGILQSNRATTFTNDFVAHLNLARSEAIKQGQSVSLCAANSSQTACSNSTNWSNGWLLFVDSNDDGLLGNLADRIKIYPTLDGGRTLTTRQTHITYSSEGFVTSGAGDFRLQASACSGPYARLLQLSASGRLRVTATDCT